MNPQLPISAQNHPISMDIQLIYGPLGVVNAVTRWISEDEMGVDTGRVLLEDHSHVEISFSHGEESAVAHHRIRAHVSTDHKGTATLHFLQCNHDAHKALCQILQTLQ